MRKYLIFKIQITLLILLIFVKSEFTEIKNEIVHIEDQVRLKKREILLKIQEKRLEPNDILNTLQVRTHESEDDYPDLISYGLHLKPNITNLNHLTVWSVISEEQPFKYHLQIIVSQLDKNNNKCKLQLFSHANNNELEKLVSPPQFKREDIIIVQLDDKPQEVFILYNCQVQMDNKQPIKFDYQLTFKTVFENKTFIKSEKFDQVFFNYTAQFVENINRNNLKIWIDDYQYDVINNNKLQIKQVNLNQHQIQMKVQVNKTRNQFIFQQNSLIKYEKMEENFYIYNVSCSQYHKTQYLSEDVLILDKNTNQHYLINIFKQCLQIRQQFVQFFYKIKKEMKNSQQVYVLKQVYDREILYLDKNTYTQHLYIKIQSHINEPDQHIQIEKYEIPDEDEDQLFFIHVEGNFLKKDLNKLQKTKQMSEIKIITQCMFTGRDRASVNFYDNHGNIYKLIFDKECDIIGMETHNPQSFLNNLIKFCLGLLVLPVIYILLRRKRILNEYEEIKQKQ